MQKPLERLDEYGKQEGEQPAKVKCMRAGKKGNKKTCLLPLDVFTKFHKDILAKITTERVNKINNR